MELGNPSDQKTAIVAGKLAITTEDIGSKQGLEVNKTEMDRIFSLSNFMQIRSETETINSRNPNHIRVPLFKAIFFVAQPLQRFLGLKA